MNKFPNLLKHNSIELNKFNLSLCTQCFKRDRLTRFFTHFLFHQKNLWGVLTKPHYRILKSAVKDDSHTVRCILKGEISKRGIPNFRIADSLALLTGTEDVAAGKSGSLRLYIAKDGVHPTAAGYGNVAKGIAGIERAVPTPKDAVNTTRRGAYWRGFLSPKGSDERRLGSSRTTDPGANSGVYLTISGYSSRNSRRPHPRDKKA